jgi:hypothetical protein
MMQVAGGIQGGNPVFGATPSDVVQQTKDLNIDDPQTARVVLSPGCTNQADDGNSCSVKCQDPTSADCPINQQIKNITDKGVPAQNIYCMGSGGSDAAQLDLITARACLNNNAKVLGQLPVANAGDTHATDQGYLQMASNVQGQIAAPPPGFDNLNDNQAGGQTRGTSQSPIQQQGLYDQVRSLSCSVPGIQNCDNYGRSMTATVVAEGQPDGGCSSRTICGAFQQTDDNYTRGMNAYVNSCDSSNANCQYVQQNCANGPSDRIGNNVCSAAAAVGLHASVDNQIQTQINDPARQAAAHMLYQLAPGQFMAGEVNNINTYQLNKPALSAVNAQGLSLSPGATGSDAIDAIMSKPNMSNGIQTAGLQNSGPLNSSPGGPTRLSSQADFQIPDNSGTYSRVPNTAGTTAFVPNGTVSLTPVTLSNGQQGYILNNSGSTYGLTSSNMVSGVYNGPNGTRFITTTNGGGYIVGQNGQVAPVGSNLSSLGLGGFGSSGGLGGLGGGGLGNLGSLFSGLFGNKSNSNNTNTSSPPPPPPPPTVVISAEPSSTTRGRSVTVQWTSNGTSLSQPCQVRASDGRIVGSANGGRQQIATGSSTPATLTFTATCYGVNGQTVQQQASVTMQ